LNKKEAASVGGLVVLAPFHPPWSPLKFPAAPFDAVYILFIVLSKGDDRLRPQMRIASQCQDHALVLLQVAQECPQFKDQAEFLARELLTIATLRIDLARTRQAIDPHQTV
jgi:hypothetical protein